MFRSVQIEGIQSKIIPGDLNDLQASHLQAKHPRQHRAAYGRLRHRLPEWASDLTRSQVEFGCDTRKPGDYADSWSCAKSGIVVLEKCLMTFAADQEIEKTCL